MVAQKLSPSVKEMSPKIPLAKENLRQYIDFLQDAFPDLTITAINELAGINRYRLGSLLRHKECNHIRPEEADALWQLYEDLKSGKRKYEPSSVGRKKRG